MPCTLQTPPKCEFTRYRTHHWIVLTMPNHHCTTFAIPVATSWATFRLRYVSFMASRASSWTTTGSWVSPRRLAGWRRSLSSTLRAMRSRTCPFKSATWPLSSHSTCDGTTCKKFLLVSKVVGLHHIYNDEWWKNVSAYVGRPRKMPLTCLDFHHHHAFRWPRWQNVCCTVFIKRIRLHSKEHRASGKLMFAQSVAPENNETPRRHYRRHEMEAIRG